ncbi:MerR family transcriptional regulator [Nesterenkonia xinjiangensis]|uniref:DNA-binding transcriptional MerR regulator n=1 Tax=Nesterenkonia xinjiangensis TaxID=225327 RepID=A0A7Z0GLF0_9MICC|nr:MerR family transcriptional regulator [Nesterenkonia xinjiangensis]NYJ77604.1 DNA-binding transcriptional MerR regulator [Nesterenkonia xinjiangensis]
MTDREWSIQELSRRAGVSSRTLRHYDAIGLLVPTRTGSDGRRHYDAEAVARLQQILVLRDLGMALPEIRDTVAQPGTEVHRLERLVERLEAEQERLGAQIRAVRHTLEARSDGRSPRMEAMMDGFNAQYKDEVIERWGEASHRRSDEWWKSKTYQEQVELTREAEDLITRWTQAAADDGDPRGERGQALAAEQVAWLRQMPGTPMESQDPADRRRYLECLAHMYVDDERFAATYGGRESAVFVRDALLLHLEGDSRI